jgi:hypothetical protein
LSALGLLVMTPVAERFVYPDAKQGTCAAALRYLRAHGPGRLSTDA